MQTKVAPGAGVRGWLGERAIPVMRGERTRARGTAQLPYNGLMRTRRPRVHNIRRAERRIAIACSLT